MVVQQEPRDNRETDWWILIDVDISSVAKPFKVERRPVINYNVQYSGGAIPAQDHPRTSINKICISSALLGRLVGRETHF